MSTLWIRLRESDLVEVRPGIWSYALEGLHISNQDLASSLDLGLVGTVLPSCADSGVDQTVSPGRIETRSIRVYAGNLASCD